MFSRLRASCLSPPDTELLHRLCSSPIPVGAAGAANPMNALERRRTQKQVFSGASDRRAVEFFGVESALALLADPTDSKRPKM